MAHCFCSDFSGLWILTEDILMTFAELIIVHFNAYKSIYIPMRIIIIANYN